MGASAGDDARAEGDAGGDVKATRSGEMSGG
jgi:hypothetical protein